MAKPLITPQEIKQKVERKYTAFLQAYLTDAPFFPLTIRFGNPKANIHYSDLEAWVKPLIAESKKHKGYGYTLEFTERNFKSYGTQTIPAKISIGSEVDFVRLIKKTGEFKAWQTAVTHTLTQFPQLKPWLIQSPKKIIPYLKNWQDILLVCQWFVDNPNSQLYLREIPLSIHTKFIETHQAILSPMLEQLLPPEAIHLHESKFALRFGLNDDEPQIRLRLLDIDLQQELNWPVIDISFRLSDLAELRGMNGRSIFIIENKMTFLTFPYQPNALAIWGAGFKVGVLKDVRWLQTGLIRYWGDIDVDGFSILSQVRGYFPQTQSFLMDTKTLQTFQAFVVEDTKPEKTLPNLTPEEETLYQQLQQKHWRLEQERIDQTAVKQELDFNT